MRTAAKLAPLAAMLILGLVGPARSEDEPAGPSATFIFLKSYDRGLGPGRATRQAYVYLPDGTCRQKRVQASFGWWTGSRRQRTLPASRPATFWMFTNHATNVSQSVCQHAMTFTPRPGATYEVALRSAVDSHCEVSVVDRANGQAPEDLTFDSTLRC
jgi:hypothetical protein